MKLTPVVELYHAPLTPLLLPSRLLPACNSLCPPLGPFACAFVPPTIYCLAQVLPRGFGFFFCFCFRCGSVAPIFPSPSAIDDSSSCGAWLLKARAIPGLGLGSYT